MFRISRASMAALVGILLQNVVPSESQPLELIDCPMTYTRSPANCTCVDSNRTKAVYWRAISGEPVNEFKVDNSSSTLIVSSPQNVNQTFVCKTDDEDGPRFGPKFAYGPLQVTLVRSRNLDYFSRCSSIDQLEITCEAQSVSPWPPKYTFYSNNTVVLRDGPAVLKYRPSRAGPLNITCLAVNSAFGDLQNNSSLVIDVREPPTERPSIQVKNLDSVLNKPVSSKSSISCEADGGYPLVDNITLTCSHQVRVTKPGNKLEATVSISMQGFCSCEASHVTGCYTNKLSRSLYLDVLFTPQEIKFTANSRIENLEVENNTRVTLTCSAEGNPLPALSLRPRSPNADYFANQTSRELTFVKNMHCQDTGQYECKAVNAIGTGLQYLQINVKCPVQLQAGVQNDVTVRALSENEFVQTISVYGYPQPDDTAGNFTLWSQGACSSQKALVGREAYKIRVRTYDATSPNFMISLTLNRLNETGFKTYILRIDNGQPGEFSYIFTLTSPNGETETCGPPVAAIVAPIVCIIVLVALVIVVVFIFKRRRRAKKTKESLSQMSRLGYPNTYQSDVVDGSTADQHIPGQDEPATLALRQQTQPDDRDRSLTSFQGYYDTSSSTYVNLPRSPSLPPKKGRKGVAKSAPDKNGRDYDVLPERNVYANLNTPLSRNMTDAATASHTDFAASVSTNNKRPSGVYNKVILSTTPEDSNGDLSLDSKSTTGTYDNILLPRDRATRNEAATIQGGADNEAFVKDQVSWRAEIPPIPKKNPKSADGNTNGDTTEESSQTAPGSPQGGELQASGLSVPRGKYFHSNKGKKPPPVPTKPSSKKKSDETLKLSPSANPVLPDDAAPPNTRGKALLGHYANISMPNIRDAMA